MLLYLILILLVALSWLALWKVPENWWEDLPDKLRELFARPAGPQWRKSLLLAGLITLSFSVVQHLTGVIYESLFHHVNHFTPEFNLLVRINVMLVLFSLLTSVFGRGPARFPMLMASFLLLFLWGVSQAV